MKKNYLIYLIFISGLILFTFSAQKAVAANCSNAYGNYTPASSCIVPDNGYMVIMNGNLYINSGVTITLGANSKLIFTTGYSVYLGGTIALASNANIGKRASAGYTVRDNSATGNSCATVCSNNGQTCAGIGEDAYATNTYYWSSDVCTGTGTCSPTAGDCSAVMTDQCTGMDSAAPPAPYDSKCCSISTRWTRCLCVSP